MKFANILGLAAVGGIGYLVYKNASEDKEEKNDISSRSLLDGIEQEMQDNPDFLAAKDKALDNLLEDPNYYDVNYNP